MTTNRNPIERTRDTMTKTKTTYEIKPGINGSGHRVWIVFSEWTGEDGRTRGHMERFDNREEAENWIRWS